MFDAVVSRRKIMIGSAAVLAAAPLARFGIVAAQTEYQAPENLGEISGTIEADGS